MIKFVSVPQSHCVILERFGKYSRTLRGGLKFRFMGLEKIKRLDMGGSDWEDVANKESYFIELAEQVTGTTGSKAYTKDNVEISVDASIFWQIVDPRKAVYESDCLPLAIRDRALGVLRASIGVFDFDELSTKREQLSKDTTEALVESGKKWGVKFTRVEIQQLQTDSKTQQALLQQVEADRHKKAIIAEAEGRKVETELNAEAQKIDALMAAEAEEQVQVLKAKGKKEAMDLESQGKAAEILNVARAQAEALAMTKGAEKEYLQDLSSIVGSVEAAKLLLAQKYIEGFENISKNPSHKVFLPNNFKAAFNIDTSPTPLQPETTPATQEKPARETPSPIPERTSLPTIEPVIEPGFEEKTASPITVNSPSPVPRAISDPPSEPLKNNRTDISEEEEGPGENFGTGKDSRPLT